MNKTSPDVLIRYHQEEMQESIRKVIKMTDEEVLETYGDPDGDVPKGVYSKPGRLRCSRDLDFETGCLRKTMLHAMNIVIPAPIDRDTRIIFARGTGIHEVIQDIWIKYGMVKKEDIEVPFREQLPVIGEGWRLSGTLDGIFREEKEDGEEELTVIELKSTMSNPKNLPLAYHHGQMTAYMEFIKAPKAWVYYIHKGYPGNDRMMGSLFAFEFHRNLEDQKKLVNHISKIRDIAQGKSPVPPPVKINMCKWCEFREHCYG